VDCRLLLASSFRERLLPYLARMSALTLAAQMDGDPWRDGYAFALAAAQARIEPHVY
jgi:hypothetical protein